jgi:hypothetical protein
MTAVTNGCLKWLDQAAPLHNGPLNTAVAAFEISIGKPLACRDVRMVGYPEHSQGRGNHPRTGPPQTGLQPTGFEPTGP